VSEKTLILRKMTQLQSSWHSDLDTGGMTQGILVIVLAGGRDFSLLIRVQNGSVFI
jgi:hypothetical protein